MKEQQYSNILTSLVDRIFIERIYEFRNKDIINLLKHETNFLDYDASPIERMYYIKNNKFIQEKCPVCGKNTKVKKNKNEYKIKCCSVLCSKLQIDPKTNKTKAALSRQKTHNTMSKIDPKTGLTGYEKAGIKIKKERSKINPKTGLTGYEKAGIKIKKERSKIDPKTGLTGYEKAGIKISNSKLQIDPKTNKTKAALSRQKTHNTMSKIDPKTGLTGYEKASYNASETMSKSYNEDGLNIHQIRTNKIQIKNKTNNYKLLIKKFPNDYILLTTLNGYIETNRLLKYQCKKCKSIRESYWPYIRCLDCYPYNISIGENEVLEFCQSITNNVVSNTRSVISPLELDIHISNHNLAIEYNGLYYHSSDSIYNENKNYHSMKTQKCKKIGIQLFHIFENEWLDPVKQEIWKSIIRNKLGLSENLYARKTEVKLVQPKDKSEFLINNHLQGDCPSFVNLGLYYKDELVSLMTFSKSRFSKKYDWELIRFCNKIGYSIIGGASKLLKHFRKENQGSVISYADLRRSNGNLYQQLGFEFSHETGPNYWYYKDPMVLESRIKYQKHKLSKILENYDSDMTESENMYNNGYRKIYDCGNQVWTLK